MVPLRSAIECNARWIALQNLDNAVKSPWTALEDARMNELVAAYGPGRWAVIASHLPGRNGKQCRERWHNQLNPAIKKDSWTPDEDQLIVALQATLGNAWAKIAEHLDGRTDNAVKNRWHASLAKTVSKRLRRATAGAPSSSSSSHSRRVRRSIRSATPSVSKKKTTLRKPSSESSSAVASPTGVDAVAQYDKLSRCSMALQAPAAAVPSAISTQLFTNDNAIKVEREDTSTTVALGSCDSPGMLELLISDDAAMAPSSDCWERYATFPRYDATATVDGIHASLPFGASPFADCFQLPASDDLALTFGSREPLAMTFPCVWENADDDELLFASVWRGTTAALVPDSATATCREHRPVGSSSSSSLAAQQSRTAVATSDMMLIASPTSSVGSCDDDDLAILL